MSSEGEIENILVSLKNVKGVHGAAIIEKFGDVSYSSLPRWVDPEGVSAMVAFRENLSVQLLKMKMAGYFFLL